MANVYEDFVDDFYIHSIHKINPNELCFSFSYPPTHPPLRPIVVTSPVPISEHRIPSGVTVPTKNQLQQSRDADTDVNRPTKPNPQPLIPLSITMQNLQNNRRGDQVCLIYSEAELIRTPLIWIIHL